jgi:hypothetical protein
VSPDDHKHKNLQSIIKALGDLRRNQQIAADDYFKGMVATAYEYVMLGEHLRAYGIVQEIPLGYFQQVQPDQMIQDGNFAYVSYSLALALVKNGYIHMGSNPVTNVPPGVA